MVSLTELANRVERDGPSYALEEEIHALMPEPKVIIPPNYTASLDAALTLVECPKGRGPCWTWRLDARIDSREMIVFAYVAEITVPSSEWRGYGRTPALALCAAALRARAAMQEPK